VRLVSLCPSITESLVALGLRDELVGVTRYCIHPREALDGLPRVGGTKNPDLPTILAARPDLVFANAEENRRADVLALEAAVPVDVSEPHRVADIPPLLRRFGRLTGREEAAEAWALKIEAALELSSGGPAFTYACLIWKRPWMTVSDETYVADLLLTAGGRNVFGGLARRYPEVTEGELVAAAPDVLLLPDEPYPFREEDARFWRASLPRARVLLVSGDDLCWHGVRTLRGLQAAAEIARAVTAAEA